MKHLFRLAGCLILFLLVADPLWDGVPSTARGQERPAEGEGLPADAGLPIIHWKDASKFVGRQVIVQGQIVQARNTGRICFLNFDDERTFPAVIHSRDFKKFELPPQVLYARRWVRIRGVISEYRGKPQIEVGDPAQITMLEKELPIPEQAVVAAPAFDGTVTVATYNVLNLFDDYDDPYHTDEGTPAKPKDQLEKLARSIRAAGADVVAMQEVENRGYLERFVHAMLPDMGYRHVVHYEGNNQRGIDCAVLSRLPVGPVTSYRHLEFTDGSGGTMRFQRDLLRVRIEPPHAPSFDVFVVHFKSKRGGPAQTERIRLGECRAARRILDELLERDGNAHFLFCGDFNDTIESQPVKALIGTGDHALASFVKDLDAEAVSFNREPHRSMIDFIFASPAMARRYVADSYRIIPGSTETTGSDHNVVLAKFRLAPASRSASEGTTADK